MFEIGNQVQLLDKQLSLIDWSFQDYIGDFSQVYRKKYQKWQCPQCLQRFRWDEQLRRHQIKMNHVNLDRKNRREKKYKKFEYYSCKKCQMIFQTHLDRVKHYRWCQKDQRTEKKRQYYKSSWSGSIYQCKDHELAHYFTTFKKLKEHLENHSIENDNIKQCKKMSKENNKLHFAQEMEQNQYQKPDFLQRRKSQKFYENPITQQNISTEQEK